MSTTVKLVLIERPKVWRTEWLTIRSNGSPAWRARFSRIRSNTTIVSWTREADDREHRGHEQGVDLDAEERAEHREDAEDDDDVVEQGRQRGHAEPEVAEPDRDPDEDAERAGEDEPDRLADEVGRDDRTDRRQAALLGDRPELGLEGGRRACRSRRSWGSSVPPSGGGLGAGRRRRSAGATATGSATATDWDSGWVTATATGSRRRCPRAARPTRMARPMPKRPRWATRSAAAVAAA